MKMMPVAEYKAQNCERLFVEEHMIIVASDEQKRLLVRAQCKIGVVWKDLGSEDRNDSPCQRALQKKKR